MSSYTSKTGARIATRRRRLARAGVEGLEARILLAASLVRDINVDTPSSNPANNVNVNGTVFFTAANLNGGEDLWKTDGTPQGTSIVKYIYGGAPNTSPRDLTAVGDRLYFRADDGVSGSQIWTSDGTADGTVPTTNLTNPSPGLSNLVDMSGTLYFRADDGVTGMELYRLDPQKGQVLVADIFPGPSSSVPSSLVWFNGQVYFAATNASGTELWKTNGTEAGTMMVKDINPGPASSQPGPLVVHNGKLYFSADDGASGRELWTSDGTEAGTMLVRDINPGAAGAIPQSLVSVGTHLFFSAIDGSTGRELWKSDGTAAGTVLVKDISPGAASSTPTRLTNLNGSLLFRATEPGGGEELYISDGTAAGTSRLVDINPGAASSSPEHLVLAGSTVFFVADDGSAGRELWKTDGAPGGTQRVADIYPGATGSAPTGIVPLGSAVVFAANDGVRGVEPWISDGSAAGTQIILDIDSRLGTSSSPDRFIEANGFVLFNAAVSASMPGRQLLRTDGTAEGTVLLHPRLPMTHPIVLGNQVIFHSSDSTAAGLWRSDGTAEGTVRFSTVRYGSTLNVREQDLQAVIGDMLYFSGTATGGSNFELWKTDGTAEGTVRVKDIYPGSTSSNPVWLTNMNGTLYFYARDPDGGYELWRSDGTEVATQRVKDIRPGGAGSALGSSSEYSALISHNNVLYFFADDGTTGRELWRSDGTEHGTYRVKDIHPGTGTAVADFSGVSGAQFTISNGALFFFAHDAPNAHQLWTTDGTEAGTVKIADFANQHPRQLIDIGGTMFFRRFTGASNTYEIWTSDGTTAGTTVIQTITGTGPAPENFTDVNGTLYFRASNTATGLELWTSDGTTAGTTVAADIIPGPDSSAPLALAAVRGTLFFSATDGVLGRELWQVPTALAAPLGLTAVSSSADSAIVTLNWAYSVSGEIDFVIERRSGAGGFAPIGTAPAGARSFVDDTVTSGEHYTYRVRATTPSGPSLYSNDAHVQAAEILPSPPLHPIATPLTDSRILVQWTDNSTIETGFRVERALAEAGPWDPASSGGIVGPNVESFIDMGLAPSTLYYYRVIAMGTGGDSAPSAVVSATTFSATTQTPFTGFAAPVPGSFEVEDFDNGGQAVAYHDTTPQNLGGAYRDTAVDISLSGAPGSGYVITHTDAGEWLEYTFVAAESTNYNIEVRVASLGPGGTFHVQIDGIDRSGPLTIPNSGGWDNFITVSAANVPIAAGQHVMRISMDSVGASGIVGYFDSVRVLASATVIVPGAPTGVAATQTAADMVTVTWQYGVGAATGFKIERRVAPIGVFELLQQVGEHDRAFVDTTAQPGVQYAYRLRAVNSAGESATSREAQPNVPMSPAVLAADVNRVPRTSASNSNPAQMLRIGGSTFFVATDSVHGAELWITDGTQDGTLLLKDIAPGASSSDIAHLTAVNGRLFFVATSPDLGRELWTSDGSGAGTLPVRDIAAGVASSSPDHLTIVNGVLYFTAAGPDGRELWRSDGTAAGTVQVHDIRPGATGSDPQHLRAVGDRLFFSADDGASGRELWVSDGTAAGTRLVADIYPGAASSAPGDLHAHEGKLFFTAGDGATGVELWVSDGTAAGTHLLRDINPGFGASAPHALTSVGPTLFFVATDPAQGTELWKTDGTAGGTLLVRDITPGAASSLPRSLIDLGGTLVFVANDPVGGAELWASDGSITGTIRLRDINPGAASSDPSSLTRVADSIFFVANDGSSRHQLWKTDGSPGTTVLVKDIYPGAPVFAPIPSALTGAAGLLFFVAHDPVSEGELWRSDGTSAGTFRVADIMPGPAPSSPQHLTAAGSYLLFSAADSSGRELWRSDGTAAGTAQVKDINELTRDAIPADFTEVDGRMFFMADDGIHGMELWVTSGSAGDTYLVKDIKPGSGDSVSFGATTAPVALSGILYFRADDGVHGAELWRSDGTEGGTYLVRDITPGSGSSGISHFTVVNGRLVFLLDTPGGRELWTSDGTEAGTGPVPNVRVSADLTRSRLSEAAGFVYFAGWIEGQPDIGTELVRSDGTAAGTTVVKDIWPGPTNSGIAEVTAVGAKVYFRAADPKGIHLWVTDGTEAGTVALKQLTEGPNRITDVNARAIFNANDGTGARLWISDGTPQGTVPLVLSNIGQTFVGDYITAGEGDVFFFTTFLGSNRWWMRSDGTAAGTIALQSVRSPVGNRVYFSATIGQFAFLSDDSLLYQSDGTVAGTFEVMPVRTQSSNNPFFFGSPFGVASDTLYFAADNGLSGFEVWKLPTVPDAPSALGTNVTGGTVVELSWQDNSANESGFRIERRLGADGAWSTIATVAAGVTEFTDATALPGHTYAYRVLAFNPAGVSNSSNLANAATPVLPAAPGAPNLSPGSDTGISASDNVTSVNTPTFLGTAASGLLVHIYADGVAIGSGVAVNGTYSITVSMLSDGVFRITATTTDGASNISPISLPLFVTIDTTAPAVVEGSFNYLVAPHAVQITFGEHVIGADDLDNITLQNLTTGQSIARADMLLTYDPIAQRSRLSFAGLPAGLLPDGRYRLSLDGAGIEDLAGNMLSDEFIFNFHFLRGDANNDGRVNLADFNILAANFGQSNRDFSEGDFNYDGVVNLADFNLLAANFGTDLNVAGIGRRATDGTTLADLRVAILTGRTALNQQFSSRIIAIIDELLA